MGASMAARSEICMFKSRGLTGKSPESNFEAKVGLFIHGNGHYDGD
jgi:hypothetical protein